MIHRAKIALHMNDSSAKTGFSTQIIYTGRGSSECLLSKNNLSRKCSRDFATKYQNMLYNVDLLDRSLLYASGIYMRLDLIATNGVEAMITRFKFSTFGGL